ncbi:site-specific integrase [Peterkaempfera griseoplana]|uniref:site-specific integrase n=1 Tax=Peterkaempfera griseoplana TaxID=66896 RepID=UPI0006E287F8|nr:site-specific integrase [Peterkaempfera griseoplana]
MLQQQERKGVPVPDKTWKVGDFLVHWLAEIVKPNVRPTTYSKYETMVRLYLVPGLGTKRLNKLGSADVRTFLNDSLSAGVGRSTVAECLKVLRNALNRAMREELLLRNVAALVDMPKVTKKESIPWSADEAVVFLKRARSHRLNAAFVLALVLGLRRGELLGLRWVDLDLPGGVAHPRKQVQRETGAGLVLVDLKTETSKSALPLPRLCIETLGERRRLQELEREMKGTAWQETGLVFTSAAGGPVDPDGFSGTFERLVKRAGVRRVRLHDTRHTCGTLLAALDVHPRYAKEILRHSQITVTLDIYTHVTSASQRAAAARLGTKLRDGLHGR